MKRKTTGILLLFCLVTPIVTMCVFLHFQKMLVRKRVKHDIIAGIHKEDLVLLKFSKEECETQLEWKHSKEFEYNQQMYDVVEIEVKGDSIYYWCWWDNEETKLNKLLDDLVVYARRNDPKQNKSKNRLSSFYKSLFYEEGNQEQLCVEQTEKVNTNYQFNCLDISHCPPVPPPETA